MSSADLPDPVARAVRGLLDEVTALKQRVVELEGERDRAGERPIGAGKPAGEDADVRKRTVC